MARTVAKGWQVIDSRGNAYEGVEPVAGSGDVDGSGTVEKADAVLVTDYILTECVPEGFILMAADMNGDGSVTVADVVLIIDEANNS